MHEDRPAMVTPPEPFVVGDRDTVLACFEATAANTFAWICRLVDGDRDLAEEVLADVYVGLQQVVVGGELTAVDDVWLMRSSFELANRAGGPRSGLTVRDRALLDLRFGQGRSDPEIATVVAMPIDAVVAAVDAAEQAFGAKGGGESVAAMMRGSARWLDDSTRRRTRHAIVSGERPAVPQRTDATAARPDAAFAWGTATIPNEERRPNPPTGPSGDLRRSKRMMVVVAAGVAALLAVGALWVSSGEPAVDPEAVSDSRGASTTSPSSATTPPTTTPKPEFALPPGYILGDIPEGFAASGSFEQLAERYQPPADGWFQLWAEPGASRTIGRWFAIATWNAESGYFLGVQTSEYARVSINGRYGLISQQADGVSELHVQGGTSPDALTAISVVSYGLTVDEMQLIVGAVVLEDVEPGRSSTVNAIDFDSSIDPVRQTMTQIASSPSPCCSVGPLVPQPSFRVMTYGPTLSNQGVSFPSLRVLTQAGPQSDQPLDRFLEPSPHIVQIGDRQLSVYSERSGEFVRNSVQWTEGDDTIIVSGVVDLETLLEVVTTVRPATAAEWRESSAIRPLYTTGESQRSSQFHDVGKVILADDSSWHLGISVDPDMVRLDNRRLPASSSTDQTFEIDPSRALHEYVSPAATVLVTVLRDPGTGTAVRVTVDGRDPITIPLTQIGETGVYAAIDAFGELAPYTVELVDGASTSLRLLTP